MEVVSTLVTALTEFITGSASAIGEGITELLFTSNAEGITGLSNAGVVIFTIMGIGFAVGLMHVIFGLIRA